MERQHDRGQQGRTSKAVPKAADATKSKARPAFVTELTENDGKYHLEVFSVLCAVVLRTIVAMVDCCD